MAMNVADKILQQLTNNQLEEAATNIEKLLRQNPNDEDLLYLAEEASSLGFIEHSIPLYNYLLKKYPNEGEIILSLAELYVELDKEDEALELLGKVSEDDPIYPSVLLLEADLYQLQGLLEVSERKLLHAKKILPNEPIIDFALGELSYDQGKFQEAIQYYEKVLKENEEIADVNVNQRIAEALSNMGSFEEALPFYEKALQKKTDLNTLFEYGFTAYQAGYYKTAIEKLTELKHMDHEFHSLYLPLADSYEHLEELDLAFQTVKDGLKQDEFNKELYCKAGKLSLKLQKEEEAVSFFREALAMDPGYLEAALTLAKYFHHTEQYEEIIETIENVKKYGEDDPQFDWMLAVAYQKLENYSVALKHYSSAYNSFKNNMDFLHDYGYFLLEEGNRKLAREIFSKLIQEDPTNEEYLMLMERLDEEQNF
jgi:tetratricopeptide (TPR) repeat protein